MNARPAESEPPVPEAASATTASPLVHVEGLAKSFGQGSTETHVLRAASLELARGETVSLVGASGSGKSTLLALLAGLMVPESGSVTFDGQELAELDDVGRAVLRSRRIGIVLQSGNLIPFLTAFENVKLAVELSGGLRAAAARAKELLSEFGLAHRLHHLPRRLSGGEAQRASLAMALANEPDLLLADEVTGELDSASADEVMRLILRAWRQRGLTVLFVTHSREIAERAQRCLRLVDGEVRFA